MKPDGFVIKELFHMVCELIDDEIEEGIIHPLTDWGILRQEIAGFQRLEMLHLERWHWTNVYYERKDQAHIHRVIV